MKICGTIRSCQGFRRPCRPEVALLEHWTVVASIRRGEGTVDTRWPNIEVRHRLLMVRGV